MKKVFLIAAAAVATLAACNKAETPGQVNEASRIVKFQVTNNYSFQTKAEIAANSQVAIYAGDPINASNQAYTVGTMPTTEPAAAGTLTGSSIEWGIEQIGTSTATKFFAMYPYASSAERDAFNATTPLAYTIDNEEYARDFLVDVVEKAPGDDVEHPEAVSFTLEHPFAMLRYVITNTSDDAIRSVTIAGVHKTGDLIYETAAITATGDAVTASELVVESTSSNVTTYYSVIVPENSINPTITITTWTGATSTYSLSAAQNFVAGNVYTANIAYNHTHGVTASNRTMTAAFAVTAWGENNVTAGAEAGYTSSTATWPILKGVGFGTIWDAGFRMTCVGENSFRKTITMTGNGEFKVFTEDNHWYGCNGTPTDVDGWQKYTNGDSNVALTASDGDVYTVYYYTDSKEIWVKAGDVTR